MRYFLYTYAREDNFDISRRAGVFGAPKNKTGLTSKFKRLQRGDLVIIRDGRRSSRLTFFGHCMVVGDPFDHHDYSPFRDFLWSDEQKEQRVIYPLRVAVDFVAVSALRLDAITWSSLDALGFEGTKWIRMEGRQAWGKKFSGNFVQKASEVEAFSKLVGYESPNLLIHRTLEISRR